MAFSERCINFVSYTRRYSRPLGDRPVISTIASEIGTTRLALGRRWCCTGTVAHCHKQHVAEPIDKIADAPDTRPQTVMLGEPLIQFVTLTILEVVRRAARPQTGRVCGRKGPPSGRASSGERL